MIIKIVESHCEWRRKVLFLGCICYFKNVHNIVSFFKLACVGQGHKFYSDFHIWALKLIIYAKKENIAENHKSCLYLSPVL